MKEAKKIYDSLHEMEKEKRHEQRSLDKMIDN